MKHIKMIYKILHIYDIIEIEKGEGIWNRSVFWGLRPMKGYRR